MPQIQGPPELHRDTLSKQIKKIKNWELWLSAEGPSSMPSIVGRKQNKRKIFNAFY